MKNMSDFDVVIMCQFHNGKINRKEKEEEEDIGRRCQFHNGKINRTTKCVYEKIVPLYIEQVKKKITIKLEIVQIFPSMFLIEIL